MAFGELGNLLLGHALLLVALVADEEEGHASRALADLAEVALEGQETIPITDVEH
jgi:hypothetical protein